MTIPSLLTGFILGVMALWIYLALAAKRRVPPPTKAKRKQPNAQGENLQPLGVEFEKVLHENLWDLYETSEPKREPSVNYTFMGATGLED